MKIIFTLIVGFVMLAGCAPRKEVVIVEKPQKNSGVQKDTTSKVDTSSYFTFIPDTSQDTSTPQISPAVQEPQKEMGFRVQIFAFSSKDKAEAAKIEAQNTLSLPVYIDYDPSTDGPYKVRVGNFVNKEDAETYKEKLWKIGYPDAFVVQCPVVNNN